MTTHAAVVCAFVSCCTVVACGQHVLLAENPPSGEDASTSDAPPLQMSDATPREGGNPCKVAPGSDNAGICTASAPPGSFSPKVKWSYTAPPRKYPVGFEGVQVLPLVGNFTDDNKDGSVDLCDTPDVIIVTSDEILPAGYGGKLRMLSGKTGVEELTFDGDVDYSVTPAFGDLDGDGLPEVVTHDMYGHLVIYENDGKIKLVGPVGAYYKDQLSFCQAMGIYDLDGDGQPEIISAFEVYDNKGNLKFADGIPHPSGYWCPANTAADLDGDGKMEVLFGHSAYHSDGTLYWSIGGPPGQPQVANLDSDPDPEIFIAREDGILVLEHDGKVKLGPIRLINEPVSPNCWSKPGAIHDFDGDGIADISASTCDLYGVYGLKGSTLSLKWTRTVNDGSGLSSTTAFDFLGKGIAQAVYTDEEFLYVFDGQTGKDLFNSPRTSRTLIEYPVVADVDNDSSADIIIVNNSATTGFGPAVQVLQDAQKRWIPTRRIWNQHAYSVTNVREDGTIPAHPAKSWSALNTFRTNAQVDVNGDACRPPVPN